ncbi:MAG: hypothetical protein V2I53_03945 [Paracoccaceae bacterium]|jgi:hypothetical protein|nr:hypothetical protein [Paracoccaceae bacterium]
MTKDDTPDPTRRRLLTRLGLAAGVAYVAPTMLHLTPAKASGRSGYSRPSHSRPSRGRGRGKRDAYEQGFRDGRKDAYQRERYNEGYRDGRYREPLTREERALEYLFETLTTR